MAVLPNPGALVSIFATVLVLIFSSVCQAYIHVTPLSDTDCTTEPAGNTSELNHAVITSDGITDCAFEIYTSFPEHAVLLQILDNQFTSTDFLFVEQMDNTTACTYNSLALINQTQPCYVILPSSIKLSFRGQIQLQIQEKTINDQISQNCSKQEVVDGSDIPRCDAFQQFDYTVHCVYQWYGTECDLGCKEGCQCILGDRQVEIQCEINYETYTSYGFIAYPRSIPHLYVASKAITSLKSNAFQMLGQSLQELTLANNSIAILDKWLFNGLSKLSALDLSTNKLSSISPETFAHLTSLTWLSLRNNFLSKLDESLFQNLRKLETLDVKNNSLTFVSSNLIPNKEKLTSLNLENNGLSTLEPDLFKGMNNLWVLYLRKNYISIIKAGLFGSLCNVQYLYLSHNQISTLEKYLFCNQTSLQELDLSYNHIKLLSYDVLYGLNNLITLDLSFNMLSELQPLVFQQMINLEHLNLQGNMLWAINQVLNPLVHLLKLDMSDNHLETLPLLGHMIKLTRLSIQENKFKRITRNTFEGLPTDLKVFTDQPEICECFLEDNPKCFAKGERSPYLTCDRLLSQTVLAVFMWVFGLAALLGNLFVLGWRWIKKHKENRIQSILLYNLAASDLLMGIYMLIIASADAHFGDDFPLQSETWRTSATCRIAGALAIISSEASVFFVTLISIDRFVGIKFPFSTHKLKMKSTQLAAFLSWTVALLLGIIPSALSGKDPNFYDNSHVCIGLPLAQLSISTTEMIKDDSYFYSFDSYDTADYTTLNDQVPGLYFSTVIFLGLNFICLIIIFACYVFIIQEVINSSRKVNLLGSNHRLEMKRQIHLTLKVAAIVATDFCCWCPIIVTGSLVQSDTVSIPPSAFAWMVIFALPINSAINPFLYTLATILSGYCKRFSRQSSQDAPLQMAVMRGLLDYGSSSKSSTEAQRVAKDTNV